MPLVELKLEIPAAAADAVDELLLELGVGAWSVLEDAPDRRAWLIGIFPDEAEAGRRWDELQPLLPAGWPQPARRPLAEADWRDSYKAHFHAWQFGRLHWVPVWERACFSAPPDDAVLWLDPGLAFGTGNHETTRLCVERLVALAAAGGARRIIDAGCGSGILALSAALLFPGEIGGFDLDPAAVDISRENAELNGLADRVRFFTADLAAGLAGRTADILMANIQADVLARGAGELTGAVAPGGTLILSGILAAELADVRAAFDAAAPGWSGQSRTLGEWCDLVLTRPAKDESLPAASAERKARPPFARPDPMPPPPSEFSANLERFTGFADLYDQFRPAPPVELASLLRQFAGLAVLERVVDLGSGTGLSSRYWSGHAREVVGIEPTADMRRRAAAQTGAKNVSYREGFSHQTGLPDRCAEVVSCSQALHWMKPQETFEEARRILRPGGVFSANDYDWPPTTGSWEAEAAFDACLKTVRRLEREHKTAEGLQQFEKSGHLGRMLASGCFRYAKEAVLHHTEAGNAERLVGVLLSQGNVMGLLKAGVTEAELGIDALRATAGRTLGAQPRTWYWSARVRLGIV